MSSEEKLLEILGLKPEKPSLRYLTQIVEAHLKTLPWENVSKLLRKRDCNLTLPSFSEYVDGLAKFQFGGTCHTQNSHLVHLLNALGFDTHLVKAVPDEFPPWHVAILTKLEGKAYWVDLGLMSSFTGPFVLDPKKIVEKTIGDQRFVFKPSDDLENWALQIYRGDKVARAYQSTSIPLETKTHFEAVRDSFADSEHFMNVLAIHRRVGDRDVGIWNNVLYLNQGPRRHTQVLNTMDELTDALSNRLLLPLYPLSDAIEVLRKNNKDLFAQAPH